MIKEFEDYVAENNLFDKEDKIVVGVSGGIDSMVLLHVMCMQGYDVSVAHCNFHLRGEESNGDAEFVSQQAAKLGLRLHVIDFDTVGYAQQKGISIQIAARELRYEWFDLLCEEYRYNKIAIAHNSDDTIETFFINALRGTGIRGLAGIPLVNGFVVRPLLSTPRSVIDRYAIDNGLSHREDSTNIKTKYIRNKIRHNVIPVFREISSDFNAAMLHNIKCVGESVSLIECFISQVRQQAVSLRHDGVEVNISCVEKYTPSQYFLYELLRKWDIEYSVVEDILKCYNSKVSGRRFDNKEYRVTLDRKCLIIQQHINKVSESVSLNVSVDKDVSVCEAKGVKYNFVYLTTSGYNCKHTERDVVFIDADKLCYPLLIREVNRGDFIVPLGMKGRKKVNDLLTDIKMSVVDKVRQQVIISGNDIVWIASVRLDDRFKITDNTKKILKISVLYN